MSKTPPPLKLTHYPNISVRQRAVGAVVELAAFSDLPDYLLSTATDVREKGASGYWVAAPVYGTRSNANTEPTRLVALDWDDQATPPDAHPGLRGLRYFAHTTDSHTEEDPRWRVWLELDREYTPAEVGRAQCPIEGVYLRAASQPAFVPTRAAELDWVDATRGGRPLSLRDWGATTPELTPVNAAPPAPAPSGPRRTPTQAATNALVARWLGRPEGTNRLAGAVGAALASWGWTDGEVADWLRALLSAGDPRIEKHINDAVRAARTRRAGSGAVPGLPTLETELGVPFEAEPSPAAWAGEEFWAELWDPEAHARLTLGDLPELDQNGWVTAAAVLAWRPPPVAWLVEGLALAPGAPVLLSGYGGSGKTTLAQHLAVCVAARPLSEGSNLSGRKVLGVLDAEHGPVTHIDYEQGVELTARRYLDLGLTADSALRFRAPPVPTPGLGADPAARAWLAEACVGQRLVLIDSFVAGLGAALEDENAAAVREPLDFLTRVSVETGAVVVVIHHSRKTQRGGDGRQTARGSSAITDAVSVHLNYERDAGGDGAVLKAVKLRRSPPAGLLAGLLTADGVRVTADLRLGSSREDETAEALLEAADAGVADAGGELPPQLVLDAVAGLNDATGRSASAVCRALGFKPQGEPWRRVRTALDTLEQTGLVVRDTHGKHPTWRLA